MQPTCYNKLSVFYFSGKHQHKMHRPAKKFTQKKIKLKQKNMLIHSFDQLTFYTAQRPRGILCIEHMLMLLYVYHLSASTHAYGFRDNYRRNINIFYIFCIFNILLCVCLNISPCFLVLRVQVLVGLITNKQNY